VTRQELADVREERLLRRGIQERQIVVERAGVQIPRHPGCAEQRLDLGPEIQAASDERVVQRLDAEAIAGEEQPSALAIEDGQPEHAAQAPERRGAPFLVAVHDHFGIGTRLKPVAAVLELPAQFTKVVDLAVEYDRDATRPRCESVDGRSIRR